MRDEPGTIGAGKYDSSEISSSAVGSISEDSINEETAKRPSWKRRITLVSALIALIAAAVIVPPLINIGRYQRQITALMSRSLGRPVHMSSVELRLLPRPGFVLHDLSVGEDPGFGAEPILSARTVVASVQIFSLWRGRLEVSRVSVDDASLNLVRSAQGRWNLESLMMGAQPALTGVRGNLDSPAPRTSAHFPYLEATDSRVNLKNGTEKSPFSIVSTNLSLWQDQPGEWRLRLRGQPVRTDMEMSLADTGDVRVEASLRRATQLREMPLNLQIEWREAQLGQLSRLLFGSDAGWRGDVTADIDVEGTLDSAQTKARLRATGVRREEFAPETPLDFDANCSFRYEHSQNAAHDVGCDTAIGDGRLHLKADLPGNTGKPEAILEVKQLPLQAGLDLLRTVRSGFAPGISVKGTVDGSLVYKEIPEENGPKAKKPRHPASPKVSHEVAGTGSAPANLLASLPTNLHGALTIEGAQLTGGKLKEPLTLPRITLAPAQVPGISGASTALGTRFTIALASAQPAAVRRSVPQPAALAQAITVRFNLGARGYDTAVNGSTSIATIRDLAYAFGLPHLDAADGFAGGAADFDFTAAGPWIPSSDAVALTQPAAAPTSTDVEAASLPKAPRPVSTKAVTPEATPGIESLSGSLQLHHTQWKAAYLASPVDLTQTTVTISPTNISLTSDFSYGSQKEAAKDAGKEAAKDTEKEAGKDSAKASVEPPPVTASPAVVGTVVVNASTNCKAAIPSDCEPQVQLRFGALDAGVVEAALLGAPAQKTLFSPLIDRMQSSSRPKWPEVAVSVQAESLVLGPVTLQKPAVRLQFKESEIVVEDWDAELLGGAAKGTGRFAWAEDKPEYSFDGNFSHLNAASLGVFLDSRWTGGPVSGNGSVQLSGLTAKELATSASGNLQFKWEHGVIATASQETHFDDWSGKIAIQGGKAQVGENVLRTGKRSSSIAGMIPFGGPVKLTVEPSADRLAANPAHPGARPAVK